MKLVELLKGLEYEIVKGSEEVTINNIVNDSRKVQEGDLFF